jgi:hypothetical protein
MNATSNPQTAAEQDRKNYSDAVRATAEKAVDQSREVYDRSKDALDASVTTLERTFDAAGQGAKNLSEMVELQAAYWQKLLGRSRPKPKKFARSRLRWRPPRASPSRSR